MTAPLSRYLKDFSAPPPVPAALAVESFAPSFAFDPEPSPPAVDVEAERAAAFADGKAAGEAEAKAAWDAERQKLEAKHERMLENLRHRLEQEAAARFETAFIENLDVICDRICTQVAPVLAPVLQESLAKKAIAELAKSVKTALQAEKAAQLTITGPASLFEAFKEALGDQAPELRHVESQDLDISVDLDDAVLVTRLSAWAGSLKKVLG